MPELVEQKQARFESAVQALQTLSPLQTLARGFASLESPQTHALITSIEQVSVNDSVQANLKDGSLQCQVLEIHRKDQ